MPGWIQGAFIGGAIGLVLGLASRGALRWALPRSNKAFFWVWGIGMAVRFAAVMATCIGFYLHWKEAMLGAVASQIAVEVLLQLWPIKKSEGHGSKGNA